MIIDSHTHYYGQGGSVYYGNGESTYYGRSGRMFMFEARVKDYLENMDRTGCDYIIQTASASLTINVNEEAHRMYGETCKALYEESKGRILSYFAYDPRSADIDLKTIEKYADDEAFVGIKIHPSGHNVSGDDEGYRAVWEIAKELNLPIMSHTWALTSNPDQKYSTPDKFVKYLEEYPEVNFIYGHSGGRTAGIIEAVEIGKTHKNAYYDMAGDVYNRRFVEYVVKNLGADRLMAGSDMAWFDFSVPMGMVLGADITTEEKALILGGNAQRIFNIK